jgi:carbon-monoxide dehydrogenase medium subunit
VKAAKFDYIKPATVEEALAVLAEHGRSARVLAGGQSLVPMLSMRLVRPEIVVDLNGLDGPLGRIESDGSQTVIGALVRYCAIERSPIVSERLPLLQHVVKHIGDRQVRNRGTLGGAVAQSDPTGEMPLACLALGATVVARSVRGEREIAAEDFFRGSYTNALEEDELLVAIRFALAPDHCRFFERGRKHNDFAILSVAVAASTDAQGRFESVHIALGGVNERPVLAHAASARLEGRAWDDALLEEASALALEAIDPPDDVRASAEYRRHLVSVHVRRLLADLAHGTR